MVSLRTIS